MYRYDDFDRTLVAQRVAQFRDQTRRYLAGQLSDDEFRPLRLQNGLYVERKAPMLRIGIPYGTISAVQLRKLAEITRVYDRGSGHFTTRQNLQLNWVEIAKAPDILAELASVDMHAIQTSGNCVRNVTTDQFAGIAADEVADPRPWCEMLRQWFALHPEFAYLPRKFKFAVNAAVNDRAVIKLHDVGLNLVRNADGELGFSVWAGGGLGRTPIIGSLIRPFLPWPHLRSYCEAIVRVFNRHGRRDNLYKARIKILVKALGAVEFARQVEEEWQAIKDGPALISPAELERVARHFAPPPYQRLTAEDAGFAAQRKQDDTFARWVKNNVHAHKMAGYAAVTLSLKDGDQPPGDCTAGQMELAASLAEQYSFGELRVSHEQNLILPDVRQQDLHALWQQARAGGLATPNTGLLTDIICCPGGEYCSLANARSIPLALAIQQHFANAEALDDIGQLSLNLSGCVNACAHHHIGNIGILGVDKQGEERYQVSLGGSQGLEATLGDIIGPSFTPDEIPQVVEKVVATYLEHRHAGERFIDTLRRLGIAPFKAAAYEKEAKHG